MRRQKRGTLRRREGEKRWRRWRPTDYEQKETDRETVRDREGQMERDQDRDRKKKDRA